MMDKTAGIAERESLQPALHWNQWAVAGYQSIRDVIQDVGGLNYKVQKVEDTDPDAFLGTVTDYMGKGPILMKFRTDKIDSREDGIVYHCVVVTLCGDKKYPYEVIDPTLGKLYFTADEFKDLLTIAGPQVIVPQ